VRARVLARGILDPMERPWILCALMLVLAACCVPTASAEPNLKNTRECSYDSIIGIGRREAQFAVGPPLVNEYTSCEAAAKAIHHGSVRASGFRTKGWTCRTQARFEYGGEKLKCRRGAKEAFEFAWAAKR
jgi:hypothetical protein